MFVLKKKLSNYDLYSPRDYRLEGDLPSLMTYGGQGGDRSPTPSKWMVTTAYQT